MERATTPPPGPNDPAPPSTPSTATPSTMRVQRNTPAPSTPGGHRRVSSIPRTPSTGALSCSSSATSFTRVTVHTAKCSECDLRNKGTMLRCPGCTFQICRPCQEGREKAGRSLAHGNMLSPQVATPGTGGSVVRRKPVASVRSVEKKGGQKIKECGDEKVKEKDEIEGRGKKRTAKPAQKSKTKSTHRAREVTPSDDSSDEDFTPDPTSPTSNKRRHVEVDQAVEDAFELPSPFLKPSGGSMDSTKPISGSVLIKEKPHSDMSTDELLAHHGVNTPANPYKAHLLSRDERVVANPVIEIPEVVRRGFKPRPTAEEIQKNIQDKVREKLGLPRSTSGTDEGV